MSPDTGTGPDDVDPAAQERVRRLLGDAAGVPAPTPVEVRTRLDKTLAELVAERRAEVTPGPAPAGRDRPWWQRSGRWLVAAAAAVVVVLGGMSVAGLGGFGGPTTTAAESGVDAGSRSEHKSDARPGSESGADAGPDQVGPAAPDGAELHAGNERRPGAHPDLPTVRSGSFGSDVARVVDRLKHGALPAVDGVRCPGPAPGPGQHVVPIALDGQTAALVVHPPRAGVREVAAWDCSGDHLLETARTPAR